MLTKSAELQMKWNEIDQKVQKGILDDGSRASDMQLNIWEEEKRSLKTQIDTALANEQAHESRLKEATSESNSFLGDIDIGGVPVAESGLSALAYSVLNAKAQAKHVAAIEKISLAMSEMQANHQLEMEQMTKRAEDSEYTAEKLNMLNNDQNVKIYQLETDNAELDNKVRKGSEALAEATETIEKQNKTIEEYKKAELLGTPQKVLPTTSEQVAQQEAEFKASQIPVTSMEVDPNDFAKKTWIIETVVLAEKRSIHYFEKGLYRVVSSEEAEQLRADEANKKAAEEAIQAAIPTIATPDIPPVNEDTRQDEATTDKAPNETDQVDTAEPGLVNSQSTEDRASVEEESEVIALESLQAQVNAIKSHLGLVA